MKYSRRRYARHATRSRTKRGLVSSALPPPLSIFLPFFFFPPPRGINFTRPVREDPSESILSIQLFHTSSMLRFSRQDTLQSIRRNMGYLASIHRFSLSRNNESSKRSFWNLDDREIWTKWIFKKLRSLFTDESKSFFRILLSSTRVNFRKPSDSPSLKVRNLFPLFLFSSIYLFIELELDSIISASKYVSSTYAPSDYKRTIFFNFDRRVGKERFLLNVIGFASILTNMGYF